MQTAMFWRPFLAAVLVLASSSFAVAQPEKTSENATTAEADEKEDGLKVRFYPQLHGATAQDLPVVLSELIHFEQGSPWIWVLPEQGEPETASATLMMRNTSEEHAQVKQLLTILQEIELISTGLFSLNPAVVEQAQKASEKAFEWPAGDDEVWRFYVVPTPSVVAICSALNQVIEGEWEADAIQSVQLAGTSSNHSDTVLIIRQTEAMHKQLETFFKQFNEARNRAPKITGGGGFFQIPDERQQRHDSSKEVSVQETAQEKSELVTRYFSGFNRLTAAGLATQLPFLVPADWSPESGAEIVAFDGIGDTNSTATTLIVRQTPAVQEQAVEVIAAVRDWAKAAIRRQQFDPIDDEIANAELPAEWKDPNGNVWQLFFVPNNSVERFKAALPRLIPVGGEVLSLPMPGATPEWAESVLLIHQPEELRPQTRKFFEELEQARNPQIEQSQQEQPEQQKSEQGQRAGVSFDSLRLFKDPVVAVDDVGIQEAFRGGVATEKSNPNSGKANASYETRYYKFHGSTAQSLQNILPQVLPEIWPADGEASVHFVPSFGDPHGGIGTLMVHQTPSGHEKIEAFFDAFRTASQELQKKIDNKEWWPSYQEPADDDSGFHVTYYFMPRPTADHLEKALPGHFSSDWGEGTVHTLHGPAAFGKVALAYSLLIVRQQPEIHQQIEVIIDQMKNRGEDLEGQVPVPTAVESTGLGISGH